MLDYIIVSRWIDAWNEDGVDGLRLNSWEEIPGALYKATPSAQSKTIG